MLETAMTGLSRLLGFSPLSAVPAPRVSEPALTVTPGKSDYVQSHAAAVAESASASVAAQKTPDTTMAYDHIRVELLAA